MSEKPALTHAITADYNGNPVPPITVEVYATDSGVAINFPSLPPGRVFSRANVFVEYDAEDGLMLRVWDGPNNDGEDPRIHTPLVLDNGEQA